MPEFFPASFYLFGVVSFYQGVLWEVKKKIQRLCLIRGT
jgi:hypothetical protein